jgi:hypothetical protein
MGKRKTPKLINRFDSCFNSVVWLESFNIRSLGTVLILFLNNR